MSLGHQLAPHLPFVRRYARALTGSQEVGDDLVRIALKGIVDKPDDFPRNVNPRLGLYKRLQLVWSEAGAQANAPPSELDNEAIARLRLGRVPEKARQALLLTAMEGFTERETAYLLDVARHDVDRLVASALAEIEDQTRSRVLILEDDPRTARDLRMTVQELGHEVVGIAISRDEAVVMARHGRPGLILADIQLADNSSGIDAVKDILAEFSVPVIFITAFPELLLTGERPVPTFLVTKPFQRSTVKAAIAQALFYDTSTLPSLEPEASLEEISREQEPEVERTIARRELSVMNLEPGPAPRSVAVINERLVVVGSPVASVASGFSSVAAARSIHHETAIRLQEILASTNVSKNVLARMSGIRSSLGGEMTADRAIELGVQAGGLQKLLPIIHEEVLEPTATDIAVFCEDLMDLAWQFPAFRDFKREARAFQDIDPATKAALLDAAKALQALPETYIEPEAKAALAEATSMVEADADKIWTLVLSRYVGNFLKAYGKYLKERAAGIWDNTNKTIDKAGGGFIGSMVIALVLVTPALYLLAAYAPAELGFLVTIAKTVKLMIP